MTINEADFIREVKNNIEISLNHEYGLKSGEYISLYTLEKLINMSRAEKERNVPDFITDWIKENKEEMKDYDILNLGFDYVQHGFKPKRVDDWIECNENLFAKTWLDIEVVE